MNKELPKFHETFNPILEILGDGKTIHHRELLNKVVNKFYSNLPEELLSQETKSGEKLILNGIACGKSYLKKGNKIILIDGPKLVDLMHQFDVGVQIKSTYKVNELDDDFFEGQ